MTVEVILDDPLLYRPQVDAVKLAHIPVIHCLVFYKGKILLLQRNQMMRYYPGYWSGVCGVVDGHIQLQDKVYLKVEEELGIPKKDMKIVAQKSPIEYTEKVYGKIWDITPFLIEIDPAMMHFDWSCQDHVWVKPKEALDYNVLPGFREVLDSLFPAKV